MQVIFRLLLAIIHVLYKFIFWSRLQWKIFIELVFSDRNSSMENDVLSELIKDVTKLPEHLVVILGHEEVSFHDLVRIVGWCVIAGIPCVSFYDHNGKNFSFIVRIRILVRSLDFFFLVYALAMKFLIFEISYIKIINIFRIPTKK